jgi:5-methylcytosine-specific restriction endonuclease McrA
MKDWRVLELNAGLVPLNLVPLSTISWQEAFKKIVEGTAYPIKFYTGEYIHTPTKAFEVPSVIVLKNYKYLKMQAKWSKFNVKLRDDFTCQYCGVRQSHKSLTIDHVVPKSHGGKHSWTNSVTSCKKCNQSKKNDRSIVPKKKPYRPTYYELAKKMVREKQVTHPDWGIYVNYLE